MCRWATETPYLAGIHAAHLTQHSQRASPSKATFAISAVGTDIMLRPPAAIPLVQLRGFYLAHGPLPVKVHLPICAALGKGPYLIDLLGRIPLMDIVLPMTLMGRPWCMSVAASQLINSPNELLTALSGEGVDALYRR